jgi:hypothetical protein
MLLGGVSADVTVTAAADTAVRTGGNVRFKAVSSATAVSSSSSSKQQ